MDGGQEAAASAAGEKEALRTYAILLVNHWQSRELQSVRCASAGAARVRGTAQHRSPQATSRSEPPGCRRLGVSRSPAELSYMGVAVRCGGHGPWRWAVVVVVVVRPQQRAVSTLTTASTSSTAGSRTHPVSGPAAMGAPSTVPSQRDRVQRTAQSISGRRAWGWPAVETRSVGSAYR